MTWRRVPPVVSPIAPASLVLGAGVALGLVPARRGALEQLVASTFGGGDVVLTDTGTSAMVLALRALARRTGHVAFPAYVCVDLTAAAERAGVGVRLYDVDPQTLGPDLASLRGALQRGVDAVVVAPLFGYPVDHPAVAAVVTESGVPLIEDAAQGAAGELRGRRVGSFGDLTVLSFGRGKGTTGGSGGALIARATALRGSVRAAAAALGTPRRGVRDVVALAAQWLLARPSLYAIPASIPQLQLGEMVYHEAGEPRGIAAVASRIVPRAVAADALAAESRRNRAHELEAASERGGRLRPVRAVDGATPGYLRLALVAQEGTATPAPRLGVFRGYPMTLDEHPRTAAILASGERAGPGARLLRDRLLTAPTHERVSRSDVRALVAWLEAR